MEKNFKILGENVKKYYKAYDDRYKIYHKQTGLAWAGSEATVELKDILKKYGANAQSKILEIGCGEGQNALFLQENGFDICATDVSKEAIKWCKKHAEARKLLPDKFFVLDVLDNKFEEKFDFILAISTIHMLVLDDDRRAFFDFIFNHLHEGGIAIVTSMGDGDQTKDDCDVKKAYNLVKRINDRGEFLLPTTSCKIVNWETLTNEIKNSKLNIKEKYISHSISGFNNSMVFICERE